MNRTILLTFDVEDWFQVENFRECIPFSSWPSCELRVEKNVHKILDLLDSINSPYASRLAPGGKDSPCASPVPPDEESPLCALPSAPCGTLRSTFFVLGWIAERLPHLVLEIQARGHEVASHGYEHKLCKDQSVDDLKNDLVQSRKLLEDVTGNPVYGYRAPSFSIDQNILRIIEDSGYLYDSSFNSFKLNRRYGQLEFVTNNGSNGISVQISKEFYELPISNLKIGNRVFPWGGGGYFRLIPLPLFKQGVRLILKKEEAYILYLHPWEIDSEQPIVKKAKVFYRFRHYTRINKTLSRFLSFLESFRDCAFATCHQYLAIKQASENTGKDPARISLGRICQNDPVSL